jgi:pimeloyl-ACP methyl ester carboxylesterase
MSTPTKKPTIIFVHGSWHDPEAFAAISSRLESSYQVIVPSLPSSGATPALPNFDQDVQTIHAAVRNVVEDKGEDCVVVMHSSGGIVGTEAMKGVRYKGRNGVGGGVVRLVYLCAFLLREGESLVANGSADAVSLEGEKPWVVVEVRFSFFTPSLVGCL